MKTTQTITVTPAQLVGYLLTVKGSTKIGLSAITEPKVLKTGNPFAVIRKMSKLTDALTAYDYENSVNNARENEGSPATFQAKPRKWGKVISPALVEHKGEYYLRTKVEKAASPVWLARKEGEGFLKTVAKAVIAPFLVPSSHAPNQKLDKEVIVRDYAVKSLSRLAIHGKVFRIRETAQA